MDKKRCVIYSEPNKEMNLKNNTLKELSGGKQINARGLYSKNTETILHATNIILCNNIPKLDDVDEAISQRLLVVPFRSLFRKPEDIAKMLESNGVAPRALHVEITEDAMVVDFETSVSVLSRLRRLGVRVAIDDFGTGYSSLQHLHRLPVDQLKIDRSFVSRMASDDRAAAIVRASINLAGDLGLSTVSEGIDDPGTLQLVSDLGCDEVQGFLIQRPLDAPSFLRWGLAWDHEQWNAITAEAMAPAVDDGIPPLRPRVALR